MSGRLRWGNASVTIEIELPAQSAPRLAAISIGDFSLEMPPGLPLIEILTIANGHALANDRLVHTVLGEESRYVSHNENFDGRLHTLELTVRHEATGVLSTIHLSTIGSEPAIHSTVTVRNDGSQPVVLRSVPSWSSYLGRPQVSGEKAGTGVDAGVGIDGWQLVRGQSDWLGEGRWTSEVLRGFQFPRLAESLTNHNPRGGLSATSTGTWSTGHHLPVAGLVSAEFPAAWAWQIEHNGPWRWEVGEDTADGYFSLAGPTEQDHQWLTVLKPGEEFESVPVTVAFASDFTAAVAALTGYRRAARRPHPDNAAMTVVFNDYMNTLDGDPTTEKLLPLIDAAAAVGAEVFCIDAGWYDDSGDWWDTVGEWTPSRTRFPGGLGEVIERIRSVGMTPGLWLEPEVIGVNSPIAELLPDEAFFMRSGQRIVEHRRFHLDLRHPAARAHLDSVVDRLVDDFGIGFFKLDYNINPGSGTDVGSHSIGDGLLGHNRAHLAWLDSVLDRHPNLVLENCGSGAMRSDFALLSRLQMQSTSDQQDYLKYPPLAAAAPVMMLPEQAASWAYPQPEMSEEEVAFCLSTGLLGRYYLSGYLNRMTPAQLDLVSEAVAAAKVLRGSIARSIPFWPLGLPDWESDWVALGLATPDATFITVWNRNPGSPDVTLDLGGALAGADTSTVFPSSLAAWNTRLDPETGTLRIHNSSGVVSARVFQLEAVVDRRTHRAIAPHPTIL